MHADGCITVLKQRPLFNALTVPVGQRKEYQDPVNILLLQTPQKFSNSEGYRETRPNVEYSLQKQAKNPKSG